MLEFRTSAFFYLYWGVFILYQSLPGEIDYTDPKFPLKISSHKLVLPKDKQSDPWIWAKRCLLQAQGSASVILIPGTKFDFNGTRYGRGGGWYDRFLSAVPVAWRRVGVSDVTQVSRVPLLRQTWDQPMDYLFIQDGDGWTIHPTGARQEKSVIMPVDEQNLY